MGSYATAHPVRVHSVGCHHHLLVLLRMNSGNAFASWYTVVLWTGVEQFKQWLYAAVSGNHINNDVSMQTPVAMKAM